MVGSQDLAPSTVPFFPNVFFRNQFRTKTVFPPAGTDLSAQVAIVTGGNVGLGFEAASQLLSYRLGHLVLGCRSKQRGEDAATTLRTKYPKAKIEVWLLDMASYDSIQSFANRVQRELVRLDMVILNAGLSNLSYRTVAATGHEEDVQINYLSTVLLLLLLLPSLKAKASPKTPSRLTIVNAALALTPKLLNLNERPFLASFDSSERFDPNEQYCCSKTLAHMFLWKLVQHVSAEDVIVNLADPGFVKGTQLARGLSGGAKVGFAAFAGMTGRTVRVGATTLVDAVVNKGKESHGTFIMSYKIHPFNPQLYTPNGKDAIEALWRETLQELAFANPAAILKLDL